MQEPVMPSAAALEPTSALTIEQVERRVQSESKSRRSRDRRVEIISPILVTGLLLGAWEEAADFFQGPTFLVPATSESKPAWLCNACFLFRQAGGPPSRT